MGLYFWMTGQAGQLEIVLAKIRGQTFTNSTGSFNRFQYKFHASSGSMHIYAHQILDSVCCRRGTKRKKRRQSWNYSVIHYRPFSDLLQCPSAQVDLETCIISLSLIFPSFNLVTIPIPFIPLISLILTVLIFPLPPR